ncbi:MAG: hypothetical protein HY553_05140 [Elusimicrobia bacterium]|nr:hypothetical protein [Elusimicrobiota bacterium]
MNRFLIAAVGVVVLASLPARAAHELRAGLRGVNIDPANPWAYPSAEVVRRLGLTRVRFVYKGDHAEMLAAVERYAQAGIHATIVLNNETADLVGAHWPPPRETWAQYRADYVRAAEDAAARLAGFGGAVSYQLWNEPNVTGSYMPPEEYGPLAREAISAVRRAHPGAPVLLGSLLHDGWSVAYLRAAARAADGILSDVDGLSVHLYGDLPALARRVQDSYAGFGKPVSITEWGKCGSRPEQNGRIMRQFVEALEEAAGVAEAYYFGWSETQWPGCGYGLSTPLEEPNAEGELYELRPAMAWAFRRADWEHWERLDPDVRLLFETGWGRLARPRWETEHALDHDAPGWRGEDFQNIDVHEWARDYRSRSAPVALLHGGTEDPGPVAGAEGRGDGLGAHRDEGD